MKLRIFLAVSFILLLSQCAVAAADDGVSVQALVDRATIHIGDRVKLTIDANYRAGTEIKFPDFKDSKIGEFEIKDSGKVLKRRLFGGVLQRRWYIVTSYVLGKHQVPEIEVKYRTKGSGDWKSVKTGLLSVTVESILPKGKLPPDIKDVKGPLRYFEINWLLMIGVVLLVVFIAAIVFYKLRKSPEPIKLPHETALEELEAVRGNFLRNSDVKEYYAGISDCVRRYIERLFKLRAPEMTTEEFLGSLRESAALSMILSLDQKDLLKEFLNACDLVKFARYNPVKGEMESIFLLAKKFIEETKGAS
ncbi:MAG: hypothetical protein WCY36_07180 [Candidatus Omnitrophota bacterium]